MEVLIDEFGQSLAQELGDIFSLTAANINLSQNLYIRNSFRKSHLNKKLEFSYICELGLEDKVTARMFKIIDGISLFHC